MSSSSWELEAGGYKRAVTIGVRWRARRRDKESTTAARACPADTSAMLCLRHLLGHFDIVDIANQARTKCWSRSFSSHATCCIFVGSLLDDAPMRWVLRPRLGP